MLWPERAPKDPHADLRSILSGLRRALGAEAVVGGNQLTLRLPEPVWVDTEAAVCAVMAARAAAREGDWWSVRDEARLALDLLEPGFLTGEDGEWAEARRRELEDTEVEAREWVARSALALGGSELAAAERAARELVSRSPYRETGYRYLMESYAAEGNTAEALRVYDELRTLLRNELGVAPAPELQVLHERILRGEWVPGVAAGQEVPTRPRSEERGALEGRGMPDRQLRRNQRELAAAAGHHAPGASFEQQVLRELDQLRGEVREGFARLEELIGRR